MLKSALEYASNGWRIFPVWGKIPVTKNGHLDATTEQTQLESWFRDSAYGCAIATGAGLVVLDIDTKSNGPASLEKLETEHGRLPPTLRSSTPSGGSHYYFMDSTGIRNSTKKLGPGIDIRGDGGYVVAPPSPGYSWEYIDDPTPLPEWVRSLLSSHTRHSVEPGGSLRFTDGSRNDRLFKEAGSLRGRGWEHDAILAAIVALNSEQCEPPLEEEEVNLIARSVMRYEPNSTGRGTRGYRSGPGISGNGTDGSGLPEDGALRRRDKRPGLRVSSYYLRGRRNPR
jgi:putative DNA primase/helicase